MEPASSAALSRKGLRADSLGIAAWLSQGELRFAQSLQSLLTLLQIGALLLLAALALWQLYHEAYHSLASTPSWLNPWTITDIGPLAADLS